MELRSDAILYSNWVTKIFVRAISNGHAGRRFPRTPVLMVFSAINSSPAKCNDYDKSWRISNSRVKHLSMFEEIYSSLAVCARKLENIRLLHVKSFICLFDSAYVNRQLDAYDKTKPVLCGSLFAFSFMNLRVSYVHVSQILPLNFRPLISTQRGVLLTARLLFHVIYLLRDLHRKSRKLDICSLHDIYSLRDLHHKSCKRTTWFALRDLRCMICAAWFALRDLHAVMKLLQE